MKTNQITIEEFNQFKTDLKEYNEYKNELYSLNRPIKITFDEMFGYTIIPEDDGTYTKITFPEVTTARAACAYEEWLKERSGNVIASAEGRFKLKSCNNSHFSQEQLENMKKNPINFIDEVDINEGNYHKGLINELNLYSIIQASFNKKSLQ